jgi:hypothetical protein
METIPPYYPICTYEQDIKYIHEILDNQLYLSGYEGAENEEFLKDN